MSLPVPLGVRFFNPKTGLDRWVTKNVDDLSFRSVAPGGYASAQITFRADPAEGPVSRPLTRDRLVQLYTRVQVVDLRSSDVVWEGRVDDDAQVVDDGGERWELGVVGSMIAATDYTRPSFYVDGGAKNWVEHDAGDPPSFYHDRPENTDKLRSVFKNNFSWAANATIIPWEWFLARAVGQSIGRVDVQYYATATAATPEAGFNHSMNVGSTAAVDVVAFSSGSTQTSSINGASGFTDAQADTIVMNIRRAAAAATFNTVADKPSGACRPIAVQVLRRDRYGQFLTSSTDYSHGAYVLVRHVIEDVVGRYLVACHTDAFTVPGSYYGSVNPDRVYIDSSATTQIKDLSYPDGVTAADIFADMMEYQPGAYWAIWESGFRDSTSSDLSERGYRFEWTQWPEGWGYILSTKDGFDEQRTARGLYKGAFVKYKDTYFSGTPSLAAAETPWDAQDVALADFRRFTTIERDTPGTESGSETGALLWLGQYEQMFSQNAGSVTVRRPVMLYDGGDNGESGTARMMQPWEIKPGKLCRITEIVPRANMNDHGFDDTAPPAEHDWNVFRVVATEYSSSDNSCRLELDQPSKWRLPTHVARPISPNDGRPKLRG